MPTLELSMIVKNAAPTLPRCLDSVRNFATEITIGDTGSTDSTADIARHYGANLISVPWQNNFSQARNAVLRRARADWILFLDADEILDPQAASVIPALLSNKHFFGYDLPIWNYVPSLTNRFWDTPAKLNPHRLAAAQSFPAYVEHKNVRLFRRHPEIFFEKRVHEGVADRMRRLGFTVGEADCIIHHLGIAEDSAEVRLRKNELYRTLGCEKIRESPDDPLAHFELGITELETFRNPAAALPHFQRVIELTPAAHRAWTFAGICQVRLGNLQEGLKRLQHAEKLGAKGAVHLEALGDAFFHLGNFPRARDRYQAAQEQGGQSALLESKLGVCELRLGNREGLRRVQNAVAREPHFAELYDIPNRRRPISRRRCPSSPHSRQPPNPRNVGARHSRARLSDKPSIALGICGAC